MCREGLGEALWYTTPMTKGGVPAHIDLGNAEERKRVLSLLSDFARALLVSHGSAEALPMAEGWGSVGEHSSQRVDAQLMVALRRYGHNAGTYAKSQLLGAYRELVKAGDLAPNIDLERALRSRPVRTLSGVAPVAVLTEPYACPGECVFCPSQAGAPKSYLDGEPGVLRALQSDYDPFQQTHTRISSLAAIGHATDKIELLILGGTWSAYPEDYQTRFLLRCFDALNEEPSATLSAALALNEAAPHRNVGLVIETRPDCVTPEEVLRLRLQGVTKVQLGAQSMNDRILGLNNRGHTVASTRNAIRLLRLGGFKIVLHWMPNLFGATPASDLEDFGRIFSDPAVRPDEMKIYPTALLEGTELHRLWSEGRYTPYGEGELIDLLTRCKQLVPPYCRIDRVMRDIPAGYIVAGTTKSNLRQIVQHRMHEQGFVCQCIRCREIRGKAPNIPLGQGHRRTGNLKAEGEVGEVMCAHGSRDDALWLDVVGYDTDATREEFLQFLTPEGALAGFLRLSMPFGERSDVPIPDIRNCAMVRELHIYGPAQELGERRRGAQHRGLGTLLLEAAADRARAAGFGEIAVIAAAGTRAYYRERGFIQGTLYPIRSLVCR
ncbi:MAG: tRNA uridine(34) 5-carboxymethylaminomethyl modification radical SAM/GNAT enzyme Elp3 [Anaerolineae bacterium]|nr:tRNA uridine(34) 5-carboxymethylaminomethyl modification radical SAM/GNAT enzyme Elp3 [Anaerolineae bacterium]